MRRAGLAVAAAAVPLAALSFAVIPLLFGSAFNPAVVPAILLIGLAGEGVAAVAIAYLYGHGMPGRASTGVAAGVVVTIALDLLLIPKMGIAGGRGRIDSGIPDHHRGMRRVLRHPEQAGGARRATRRHPGGLRMTRRTMRAPPAGYASRRLSPASSREPAAWHCAARRDSTGSGSSR